MAKNAKSEAEAIACEAIRAVLPDGAVKAALEGVSFPGRVFLVSVGKAGWTMAKAAREKLGSTLTNGVVITKYHHAAHFLPGIRVFEAGHPIPDENTFAATRVVLDMTQALRPDDTVLFLLSGGGSALFEQPLVTAGELEDITSQLLRCGADIVEMNTIRKRLSGVKAGRFARHCAPAQVFALVLSDVVGDVPHMIASGPVSADPTTADEARAIAGKYGLRLSANAWACLDRETPKTISNARVKIIGSAGLLCHAAARACAERGYVPVILTESLAGIAREAGASMGKFLAERARSGEKLAFLAGGETVVHVRGSGKGGRNQELALAAASFLDGIANVCLISVGTDGTDGPTDAAGGYVDGQTMTRLAAKGGQYEEMLANNDSYHALQKTDGLIITGPTGTNVNDIVIGLVGCGETSNC